jgi:hypothetical protein
MIRGLGSHSFMANKMFSTGVVFLLLGFGAVFCEIRVTSDERRLEMSFDKARIYFAFCEQVMGNNV